MLFHRYQIFSYLFTFLLYGRKAVIKKFLADRSIRIFIVKSDRHQINRLISFFNYKIWINLRFKHQKFHDTLVKTSFFLQNIQRIIFSFKQIKFLNQFRHTKLRTLYTQLCKRNKPVMQNLNLKLKPQNLFYLFWETLQNIMT